MLKSQATRLLLILVKTSPAKAFTYTIGRKFDVSCQNNLFMKNIKSLLGLLSVVVVMASCATMQGATDDDYANSKNSRQIGNRLYVDDPYYGTVILERNPFTGRYYDVTYGAGYGAGYYGSYPNRRYRVYHAPSRGGNVNRGTIVPQKPTVREVQQGRDKARKTILGN